MSKVVVCLFLAFTLLVAPAISAAGLDCESSACHKTEQSDSHSKSNKSDEGKLAKAGHHCCCVHLSAQNTSDSSQVLVAVTAKAFVTGKNESIVSVVVGQPLKPPSHA